MNIPIIHSIHSIHSKYRKSLFCRSHPDRDPPIRPVSLCLSLFSSSSLPLPTFFSSLCLSLPSSSLLLQHTTHSLIHHHHIPSQSIEILPSSKSTPATSIQSSRPLPPPLPLPPPRQAKEPQTTPSPPTEGTQQTPYIPIGLSMVSWRYISTRVYLRAISPVQRIALHSFSPRHPTHPHCANVTLISHYHHSL